jgi:predicted acyl esterase
VIAPDHASRTSRVQTLAAASQRHPTVRAFFAQVGGSNIYDDVVYEGQSIEIERLWLWVAGNVAGLSASHLEAVAQRRGLSLAELAATADSARTSAAALTATGGADPPFVESVEWMHQPLTSYPDFSVCQPYLDESCAIRRRIGSAPAITFARRSTLPVFM